MILRLLNSAWSWWEVFHMQYTCRHKPCRLTSSSSHITSNRSGSVVQAQESLYDPNCHIHHYTIITATASSVAPCSFSTVGDQICHPNETCLTVFSAEIFVSHSEEAWDVQLTKIRESWGVFFVVCWWWLTAFDHMYCHKPHTVSRCCVLCVFNAYLINTSIVISDNSTRRMK